MTTHYLKLPGLLQVVNVDDGTDTFPSADGTRTAFPPMTHVDVCRSLTNQLRTEDKLDVLECMDLRAKLTGAAFVAELTDAEHKALSEVAKHPKYLSLHTQMSPAVVAFLRSIVDAPTSKPDPE
jgi:hypothetical protein